MNDTMKLLSKQTIPSTEAIDQIEEIIKAHEEKGNINIRLLANDCFNLGRIYGKREERA